MADLVDVTRRVAEAYGRLDHSWVRAHLSGVLSRVGVSMTAAGPAWCSVPGPRSPDIAAAGTALLPLLDLPLGVERDRISTLMDLDEFQDLLVARRDLDGLLRSRIRRHPGRGRLRVLRVGAVDDAGDLRHKENRVRRPMPLTLGPLSANEQSPPSSLRASGSSNLTQAWRWAHWWCSPLVPTGGRCCWPTCSPTASRLATRPRPALADAVIDEALRITLPRSGRSGRR